MLVDIRFIGVLIQINHSTYNFFSYILLSFVGVMFLLSGLQYVKDNPKVSYIKFLESNPTCLKSYPTCLKSNPTCLSWNKEKKLSQNKPHLTSESEIQTMTSTNHF